MPRPTPRQRAVLEAMSSGDALFAHTRRLFMVHSVCGLIRGDTVSTLISMRWIESDQRGQYVITEAGRRAVARDNGGV